MEYKRLMNNYLVDDIFKVSIYRSVLKGSYFIIILNTESGEIKDYNNIESVPTFGMIENYIKLDFNYGN